MKPTRFLALAIASLAAVFLVARWCAAQSTTNPPRAGTDAHSSIGFRGLESFVAYLNETKQTNILARFNEYSLVTVASQKSAELGMDVRILQMLRTGHTNEAFEILEMRITGDATALVGAYRELPPAIREKVSLHAVRDARDYRANYPYKHRYPVMDAAEAEAFKILDERPPK